MRLTLPRGRALLGAVLYGLLSFGPAFGFLYWALLEATAGTAMVVLATVPMLTLVFAVAVGVERFTLRGVFGAIVAATGIVIVFADALATASLASVTALLGAAASLSASPIVVKTFPKVHAVSENAVGMLVGSAVLLAASILTAEQWAVPVEGRTRLALAYVIVVGSVGMFLLFLFVLRRMTASGANYILLLAPLSAVALGGWVLGERIGPLFVVGGALVVLGVYIGVMLRPRGSGRPV